ncbi:hypothetical protein HS1genome_2056 [Sulfodiicoccus acidiphilus]|uniref:Uncharacterized protein n=1 Tax=Sulfodiicoccus acidiphilus TaxID=1670455 RepID=A0A348B665_9CREN|nr:hypothetical protein HS1genome_2056 [Sulfodiicoccus acidiphilus]GGU01956.1 hypothetical protein GCM10007116_18820 [Sulfodiicoccus acidiphilus]
MSYMESDRSSRREKPVTLIDLIGKDNVYGLVMIDRESRIHTRFRFTSVLSDLSLRRRMVRA